MYERNYKILSIASLSCPEYNIPLSGTALCAGMCGKKEREICANSMAVSRRWDASMRSQMKHVGAET